jgi:uncharacterized integral membrane protein
MRMGGWWVASALFALVLLVLLIFILENGQRADIGFFGAHGHLPLGIALLLAAILGVLLVVVPDRAHHPAQDASPAATQDRRDGRALCH